MGWFRVDALPFVRFWTPTWLVRFGRFEPYWSRGRHGLVCKSTLIHIFLFIFNLDNCTSFKLKITNYLNKTTHGFISTYWETLIYLLVGSSDELVFL